MRRFVRVRLTDVRLRRFIDSVDICQSILGRFFTGFFAGKYQIQGPDQLIALLLRMARNELCDQLRRQRRRARGPRRSAAGIVFAGKIWPIPTPALPSKLPPRSG